MYHKKKMRKVLKTLPICIEPLESEYVLDIIVHLYGKSHDAMVRIARFHTNVICIQRDQDILHQAGVFTKKETSLIDRTLLNVKDICEFASLVDIDDVKDVLQSTN